MTAPSNSITCKEYVNEDRHVPVHIIPGWYTLRVKVFVPETASTVPVTADIMNCSRVAKGERMADQIVDQLCTETKLP